MAANASISSRGNSQPVGAVICDVQLVEPNEKKSACRGPGMKVIWLAATVALTILLLAAALPRGGDLLGALAGLRSLTELTSSVWDRFAPVGANLWLLQWRYLGRPDPRPLWDPASMGTAAPWLRGSPQSFAAALRPAGGSGGGPSRLAVVGNGPITEEQRAEIERADSVVRFNAMNNRRVEERVDVWVVRSNGIGPWLHWGFEQLSDDEIDDVLSRTRALLFLEEFQENRTSPVARLSARLVENLGANFAEFKAERLHQIEIDPYWSVYSSILTTTGSVENRKSGVMPSSGLLGLLAALDGAGNASHVDLYGFNWNSERAFYMHKMSDEELIVHALAQRFPGLRIHPTACNGLYHCEQLCDTGQFRTAVDEGNCQHQLAKAKAGEEARFIDQHTTQHLDWHAGLREELQGVARKQGIRQPSAELLKAMARQLSDDVAVKSPNPHSPKKPKARLIHLPNPPVLAEELLDATAEKRSAVAPQQPRRGGPGEGRATGPQHRVVEYLKAEHLAAQSIQGLVEATREEPEGQGLEGGKAHPEGETAGEPPVAAGASVEGAEVQGEQTGSSEASRGEIGGSVIKRRGSAASESMAPTQRSAAEHVTRRSRKGP